MKRDDDLRELFESAKPSPTSADREAILRAAEPRLAELAAAERDRAAVGAAGGRGRSLAERLGDLLAPRRLGFAAAVALVLALVLLGRGPETRDARPAPLQSWAEHTAASPDDPVRLVAATFARPY